MTSLGSDHARIVRHCKWRFIHFQHTFFISWNVIFRGMRNIWWRWRVSAVALRNVNDFSYVTRINHESDFSGQAQYLVRLDGHTCCSAQCNWRFISFVSHIVLWLLQHISAFPTFAEFANFLVCETNTFRISSREDNRMTPNTSFHGVKLHTLCLQLGRLGFLHWITYNSWARAVLSLANSVLSRTSSVK